MINRLHQVSTYLLIALGVVHTALTPVFNRRFSVGAMYFAAAGLAMIVIGFLNVIMRRGSGKDRVTAILCYIANVLFTVFGLLTVIALREPQAYFGLLLIITMTTAAFMLSGKGARKE